MKPRMVTRDDLEDVKELECKIYLILEEQETWIAISALTSALINVILRQCTTTEALIYNRNILMKIFDEISERTNPAV